MDLADLEAGDEVLYVADDIFRKQHPLMPHYQTLIWPATVAVVRPGNRADLVICPPAGMILEAGGVPYDPMKHPHSFHLPEADRGD